MMEDAKRTTTEAATLDRKRSCRLYPSLPKTERYEVSVPQGAAARHLQSRSTDTQAETAEKAQIFILEEQKRELLLINDKWAREYRIMKQFYSEKVRELRLILQHDFSHTKEETSEGPEKTTTAGTEVRDEDGAKAGDVREAELRVQNGAVARRWQHQRQHQRQETRNLNQALQGSPGSDDASGDTLQDVWKHQAEVYREDFLKERRDREELHGRYLELEKKYRRACRELRLFKPQAPSTKPVVNCSCRNHPRPRSPTDQPPHGPTAALNLKHH